jgi:putative transposase
MTRPLRIEYPGSLWHVTVRGNERRDIYRDDVDRELFLELLGEAVTRFGWILDAYVLMSNHFHLLVQLTVETLARGMQWLDGSYAHTFNRRHGRVGHLYQGPYWTSLVQKEVYFQTVLRYIVLNPVRAGMVGHPRDYAWSSYPATAGSTPAPDWLATDEVLSQFGATREVAQERYRAFIDDGIGNGESPWKHIIGQIYLGSEGWAEGLRDRVASQPRDCQHPRVQREVGAPPMAVVVRAVAEALCVDEGVIRDHRGGAPRLLAAWIGAKESLLPLSAIAAGLRLRSAGHVSDLIRRCDEQLQHNEMLQSGLARCLSTIRSVGKTIETKI